jgi:filamentous hemagglutinin family protein
MIQQRMSQRNMTRTITQIIQRLSLTGVRSLIVLAIPVLPITSAQAQIRPDATLANPTVTRTQNNTIIITGGTQAGRNLFHSFQRFSVPSGRVASFRLVDSGIANIISRITGASPSRINGAIEVLQANGSPGSANLFLINPNGIIFGANASLNLGGSFFATTADRIVFADGIAFSAVTPTPSLLTVSVPVGLQLGQSPGQIQIRAGANLIIDDLNNPPPGGLQVGAGQTLALVGSRIVIPSGFLRAAGGRVALGSVERGSLGLSQTGAGWRLEEAVGALGEIQLSQGALVSVSGTANRGGGTIQIQGRQVTLTGESLLVADTVDRHAGAIEIRADNFRMDELSAIASQTQGSGRTAHIDIKTDRLSLRNGAYIAITTAGTGSGGNLTVQAADAIELSGGFPNGRTWEPSGLFNQVGNPDLPNVEGRGGNIAIATPALRLLEGAQINVSTFALGNAGSIQIDAATVEIDGVALNNGQRFAPEGLPFGSGIFAGTGRFSRGQGGTLRLTTDELSIRNGAVLQTTTFGAGDAGNLSVQAAEWIEVTGTDVGEQFPSAIIAASGGIPNVLAEGFPEATGRGGTLQIQTGELRVTDGAAIAVGSLNANEATARGGGTATIQANLIDLSDEGRILTETASGNGGNIRLSARDLIALRNRSQISTTAGSDRAGGDGGNITVDANYLVSALSENNDITANAYTGDGGNIRITATGIFGIVARSGLTNQSDITASSALGVDGSIEINAPNITPSRELAVPPTLAVNAQLDQRCQPRRATTGQLIQTGQGGLAPALGEGSAGETWEDLRPAPWIQASDLARADSELLLPEVLPPESLLPEALPSESLLPEASGLTPATPVLEAQGWGINAKGQVILTIDSPAITPYSSWQSPAQCQRL